MKFRMIVRTSLMLMTIGAALLLANSVYAQQDMDPTSFADGPNVTAFTQPVSINTNSTFTMDSTNTVAALPATMVNDDSTVQEASVAQWTPADAWSMTSLMVAMGLLVLYGVLQSKRERAAVSFRPRTLTPSDVTAR